MAVEEMGSESRSFSAPKPMVLPASTEEAGAPPVKSPSGRPLCCPQRLALGNQREEGQQLALPSGGSPHFLPEKQEAWLRNTQEPPSGRRETQGCRAWEQRARGQVQRKKIRYGRQGRVNILAPGGL